MSNKIIFGIVIATFSFSSAASAVTVLDGLRQSRSQVEVLHKTAVRNVWGHTAAAATQITASVIFPLAALSCIDYDETKASQSWQKLLSDHQTALDQINPAIRFLTQVESIYRDLHPNGMDALVSEKVDVTSRLSRAPKELSDTLYEMLDRENIKELIDRIHLANMKGMDGLLQKNPLVSATKSLPTRQIDWAKGRVSKIFSYYTSPDYFGIIKDYIIKQGQTLVITRERVAAPIQTVPSSQSGRASDGGAASGNPNGMDSNAPPAYEGDEKK